jgi:EAL domain-containing protein (putative c-di-GMP-specific phosphodiesterase class I)
LNDAIDRVRALGVRLAIDDAGAGFASLRHILRLAPDFVKLDRTLIDDIERDRSHQALAAGLISFANKIDATIVAEGIERDAQLRALRELGVSRGQGFLLARPAPLPLEPVVLGGGAALTRAAPSAG